MPVLPLAPVFAMLLHVLAILMRLTNSRYAEGYIEN